MDLHDSIQAQLSIEDDHIEEAIRLIKEARSHLVAAHAHKAADSIRRALKSAEGARRNRQRRTPE